MKTIVTKAMLEEQRRKAREEEARRKKLEEAWRELVEEQRRKAREEEERRKKLEEAWRELEERRLKALEALSSRAKTIRLQKAGITVTNGEHTFTLSGWQHGGLLAHKVDDKNRITHAPSGLRIVDSRLSHRLLLAYFSLLGERFGIDWSRDPQTLQASVPQQVKSVLAANNHDFDALQAMLELGMA